MGKNKYGLIAIGYNRVPGLLRLLDSLNQADYGDEDVTLIISLDNCGTDFVEKAVQQFVWSHGEKRIRTFEERQGLRKHILSCGDFLHEFDAIAVFEDDLVVAPDYYNFMKQAVQFYRNNEKIAGISLYSHRVNTNVYKPFLPQPGIHDVFFLQYAQSWGQVWIKEQWFAFKDWYEKHCDEPLYADNFPERIANWSKSSWLKYHIKYCVETEKYFVYPYNSLTTCFSDAGQHSKETSTVFQVPLQSGVGKQYTLCGQLEQGIVYDVFFERVGIGQAVLPEAEESDITIDLYGSKKAGGTRYQLSTRQLPYAVVKTYGLMLRPHEENVLCDVSGDVVYLYDTEKASSVNTKKNDDYTQVSYYYNIAAEWKSLLSYFVKRIMRKAKRAK